MANALVAGHNRIVPGASGCGYKEHEVARKMVARVKYYLELLGEKVYDCTDDKGSTQAAVWKNAVYNTNQAIGKEGRATSIHLNAHDGTGTGVEVLTMTDREMAAKLSAAIAKVLGLRDRGVKDGSQIGYINSTKATANLIELCFIDNPSDMKALMEKFEDVAIAIAETLTGKTVPREPEKIVHIETGGLSTDAMVLDAIKLMRANGWGYTLIEFSGKSPYLRTGGLTPGPAEQMKKLLDEKKWWYRVV